MRTPQECNDLADALLEGADHLKPKLTTCSSDVVDQLVACVEFLEKSAEQLRAQAVALHRTTVFMTCADCGFECTIQDADMTLCQHVRDHTVFICSGMPTARSTAWSTG